MHAEAPQRMLTAKDYGPAAGARSTLETYRTAIFCLQSCGIPSISFRPLSEGRQTGAKPAAFQSAEAGRTLPVICSLYPSACHLRLQTAC